MNINLLEWLGYLASILVAISLLMSSIVKLRWYNLVGAIFFTIYGFSIGALPVGFINLFIIFINLYYLYKIYSEKEYFKIIEIGKSDEYLKEFFSYFQQEIKEFFPLFKGELKEEHFGFYILRNLVPAGIFIAAKYDETTLMIDVDFAVPAYRDFKLGRFIYHDYQSHFYNLGYRRFITFTENQKHLKYLKKMGFTEAVVDNNKMLVKSL